MSGVSANCYGTKWHLRHGLHRNNVDDQKSRQSQLPYQPNDRAFERALGLWFVFARGSYAQPPVSVALPQLKSGKTLSDIATAQNISSTQLQTIVGNAIQNALKPAVTDGTLTQKQVDKLTKRFQSNPVLLDHLLTIQ